MTTLKKKDIALFKHKIEMFGEALAWENIEFRADFACCQSCGHCEMEGELKEGGYDAETSYVFYHNQTQERLDDGSGILHLQHYIKESDVATVVSIVKAYGGYWNATHHRAIQLPFVRFTAEQLKEMKEIDDIEKIALEKHIANQRVEEESKKQ